MHKYHFACEVLKIPCRDEVREGNHSEPVGSVRFDAASEAHREWTGASEAVRLWVVELAHLYVESDYR